MHNQEPMLPDQIADAWAAVLIDIYQQFRQREEAAKSNDQKRSRCGTR
jgi:hypothetical protein